MRVRICQCGKTFETKHSHKFYCTSKCQLRYSVINAWDKVKKDYRFRCRKLCESAKYRAKIQKLEFNLTPQFLVGLWERQDGKCSISGRIFDLRRPNANESARANTPSLDRINSCKGYTQDNVRFVCYQVNTALNEYGDNALFALCKDIIRYNGILM